MPRKKKEEIVEEPVLDEELDELEEEEEIEPPKAGFKELIQQMKVICIQEDVPMFLLLGERDENNRLKYHYEIVNAALELPGYAKRIYNLLLAVGEAGTKYPEHIRNAINDLQSWIDNEQTFSEGYEFEDDEVMRKMVDIGTGQMEPELIHIDDDEEVDGEA